MKMNDDLTPKCELCNGYHDAFDFSECFNRSIENILKTNPNHFKERHETNLKLTP